MQHFSTEQIFKTIPYPINYSAALLSKRLQTYSIIPL